MQTPALCIELLALAVQGRDGARAAKGKAEPHKFLPLAAQGRDGASALRVPPLHEHRTVLADDMERLGL